MPAYRVVVTDHIFPSRKIESHSLAESLGADLVFCTDSSEETLERETRDADAVLVTFAKLPARVIEGMSRCRIIARYGVGVDNIDVGAATRRGIAVTNVPDYCTDEVSDHALALLLTLTRKTVLLDRQVHQGGWDFRLYRPIPRLRGAVLGLIGYGQISRKLAAKARALGMQVLVFDPYVEAAPGVDLMELEPLLASSDFVSIHCPLTPETRHLINAARLRLMKPTAMIVNTARGGIIDEEALAEALQEGRIAGAGLDVLETEPIRPDHPLLQIDRCLITPHCGFHSEEATIELQVKAVHQVVKALTGEPLDYQVNRL